MKATFRNKRISGILTVLPEREVRFEDEVGNYDFPEKQTMRLKKVMGFEKHRLAKPETSSSDLAVFGVRHLLEKGILKREEIGAIVVVTASPDHFIPHVSNIVQGECDFSQNVFCVDIPQGCCGFLLGLVEGFMLLDHLDGKKALLINTDVLSHKVSPRDRKSFPLTGDGATITLLEPSANTGRVCVNLYMDGKQRNIVLIPAGGSRMPSTPETAEMHDDGEGNWRSLDNLRMDGNSVFNFVQTCVPSAVEETLDMAGWSKESVDLFLCHQPNRFVLRKFAERLGVPYEKVPMNLVENYGNTSGACIPMVITHNLSAEMIAQTKRCCLIAFGSGMVYGAVTMELGDLSFCDTVESPF